MEQQTTQVKEVYMYIQNKVVIWFEIYILVFLMSPLTQGENGSKKQYLKSWKTLLQ